MAIKREAHLMPDARSNSRPDADDTNVDSTTLEVVEEAVGLLARLQVFSSLVFRFFVYVFLRWIPNSGIYKLLFPTYAVYVITWCIRQVSVRRAVLALVTQQQFNSARADLKELADKADVGDDKRLLDVAAKDAIENRSNGNGEGSDEMQDDEEDEEEEEEAQEVGVRSLSAWELITVIILGRSTRSATVNLLSFAFHTLLFLFFLDSSWSPLLFPSHHEHNLHFAHVGALGPKSAVIHVRYPFPLGHKEEYIGALIEQDLESGSTGGALKDMEELLQDPQPIRLVYREVRSMVADGAISARASSIDGRIRTPSKRWERGPLLTITEHSDWTSSAKIDGLWPATEYEWRLAFSHNSTFTPMPSHARRFVTWPDPRLSEDKSTLGILRAGYGTSNQESLSSPPLDDPNHFAFGSSSCIKPDFPWSPTQFWAWSWAFRLFGLGDSPGGFALRNRVVGFDKLAQNVLDGRDKPALRFFLQLGDLIYVDSPFYPGAFDNTYRKLYRNLFASESFRRVYERLPTFGIYDDHEVINNWGGKKLHDEAAAGTSSTTLYEPEEIRPAFKAWHEYVGRANPDPLEPNENYYTFRYGDTAFFVMDTRKHRSPWQNEDDEYKSMLGDVQREAFVRWLGAVNSTATFKFVVSSVPFNTLWGGPLDWDGKTDSWAAYTHEREYLLSVMQYVPNIIVLSGDRHEFASVGLATRGTRADFHPVTEFSTSPLNMFYLPVRTLSSLHGLGPTGAERLFKYIPDGNVKWSEFEVDTRDANAPLVKVKVVVDGKPAWHVTVHGVTVHHPRHAVGGLAKTFLELLNWRPRRWF